MEQLFNTLSAYSYTGLTLLINSLIIGTMLALLLFVCKKYFWEHLSKFRYLTWWLLLLCILVLPVITVYYSSSPSVTSIDNPVIAKSPIVKSETTTPATIQSNQNTARIKDTPDKQMLYTKTQPQVRKTTPPPVSITHSQPSLLSTVLKITPLFLTILWLMTALYLVTRLLFAYYAIKKIKRTASRIDITAFPAVETAIKRLDLRRPVTLALSYDIASPMAAGFKNPMVLLPVHIMDKFTTEELEIIILHEVAHLKRYDDISKLGQRLVEAVSFFHPVVHWIGRQLDLEREMACDEIVVAHTGAADRYARCLTKLIEIAQGPPNVLVPGAYTSKKQIFKRFEEILMKKKKHDSMLPRTKLFSIIGGLLFLAFSLVQVTPVVAFPGKFVTYQEISDIFVSPVEKLTTEVNSKDKNPVVEFSGMEGDSDEDDYTDPLGKRNRGSLLSRLVDWTQDVFDHGKGTMISVDDDGQTSLAWSDGRTRIRVKMEGEIKFTDDEKGIKSISDGGYFALYEKTGSKKYELDIEPDRNGDLDIIYYENGDEKEFDASAQEWLGETLLLLYYKTGMHAEHRVERMFNEGGANAVLNDMDNIRSDYVYRLYMTELLNLADLSDAEYARVMDMAGENIDSDYEKAELLIDIAPTIQRNQELVEDYVNVVRTIDSDYETRRVLSEISFDRNSDKKLIKTVLSLTNDLDSDYEQAELMIDLADICADDPELSEQYIMALRNIDSDYETRRVFTALGQRSELSDASLAELIALSEELDSDYERAEFLIELASMKNKDENKERQLALIKSASAINSDYEKRRVLQELEYDCELQSDLLEAKLKALTSVDSDYERVEALLDNADCASKNELLQATYLRALESVNSDYEKKRALVELMEANELKRQSVINILKSAATIDSDYDKSQLLKKLARYCRGDDELEEIYLDIVDRMSSDYEMKELYYQLNKRKKDTQFD